MDQHLCGSCGKLFCRIEDFVDHKKFPCKATPETSSSVRGTVAEKEDILEGFKKWSDSSIFKCEMCGWKGNRLAFHRHVKDNHGEMKMYRKAYGSGLLIKEEHKCLICHKEVLLDHYTFQNHVKLVHRSKPIEYYKKYVAGIRRSEPENDASNTRECGNKVRNWILEHTEGGVNIELDKTRLNQDFFNDEAHDKSVQEQGTRNQPDEEIEKQPFMQVHNLTLAEYEQITELDLTPNDGAGINHDEVSPLAAVSDTELNDQNLHEETDPLAGIDIPMEDERTEGICENDQPVVKMEKRVSGSNPTYTTMVIESIVSLKDETKWHHGGVFLNAITSFIMTKYQVGSDIKLFNAEIKRVLRRYVAKGVLEHTPNSTVSFKVADKIYELLDKGVEVGKIAEIVGCRPVTIGLIRNNWKKSKDPTPTYPMEDTGTSAMKDLDQHTDCTKGIHEQNQAGKEAYRRVPDSHPTYITMVIEAITTLKDKKKWGHSGVSRQAIESFITSNYQVENNSRCVSMQINHALRNYVAKGVLALTTPKSQEAGGCFKVVTKNLKISKTQTRRWRISELLTKGFKMAKIARIVGVSAQTVRYVAKMKKEGKSLAPAITFRNDGRSIEQGSPILTDVNQGQGELSGKRSVSPQIGCQQLIPTPDLIEECDIKLSAPYTLAGNIDNARDLHEGVEDTIVPPPFASQQNKWWTGQRSEAEIVKAFRSWCDFSIIRCTLCYRECNRESFYQHLRKDHAYKHKNSSALLEVREHQCLICHENLQQCQYNLENHFGQRHNMEVLDYYKKYVGGVRQESIPVKDDDDLSNFI